LRALSRSKFECIEAGLGYLLVLRFAAPGDTNGAYALTGLHEG
jgi:hypothetical protein